MRCELKILCSLFLFLLLMSPLRVRVPTGPAADLQYDHDKRSRAYMPCIYKQGSRTCRNASELRVQCKCIT